jgi:hypothetical protein
MASTTRPSGSIRGALALHYGLTGILNALWGATLPATDARLDLGAGWVGGLLAALAVSALVAMPVTGWLAGRWPGRRMLRLAVLAASLAVAGPALAKTHATLAIAVVVLGAASGALNVTLSVQAIAVERALGRPVIAAMHGTWALGAVIGGAAVSVGLRVGVDVRAVMLAGAVIVASSGLAAGRRLREPVVAVAEVEVVTAKTAALGPGIVLSLGLVGAAAFLTEGAAVDWAGVHATRVLGADPGTASVSYTMFVAAMTAVRFVGDPVRGRLGAAVMVRVSGCTASAGLGLVLLSGALPDGTTGLVRLAIAGWALAGAGMALVWPIVTSALGTANAAPGRLSAVTTISHAGGLAGPALIGYVATSATLPVALLIPAAAALLLAAAAPAVLSNASKDDSREPDSQTTRRRTRARRLGRGAPRGRLPPAGSGQERLRPGPILRRPHSHPINSEGET